MRKPFFAEDGFLQARGGPVLLGHIEYTARIQEKI
jgi:hypothetical protein